MAKNTYETFGAVIYGITGKRETGVNPVRSRHCKQGVRNHVSQTQPLIYFGKAVLYVDL